MSSGVINLAVRLRPVPRRLYLFHQRGLKPSTSETSTPTKWHADTLSATAALVRTSLICGLANERHPQLWWNINGGFFHFKSHFVLVEDRLNASYLILSLKKAELLETNGYHFVIKWIDYTYNQASHQCPSVINRSDLVCLLQQLKIQCLVSLHWRMKSQ